ncbi:MAG: bifunctional diguanylate cyclase/phosphodiesterase [Deltaproteobacteria bacterium]|nr:bifunctional diguanylate cyclase/phosphodiesterase [Deltaproteobacteria bacterium]
MFLLRKFISFTSFSLKRFIFTATLIVSITTFLIVVTALTWIFSRQAENIMASDSAAIARQTSLLIIDAMKDSRSQAEMTSRINRYRHLLPPNYTIVIRPGRAVRPAASNKYTDELIRRAFAKGKSGFKQTITGLEYVFPLKAKVKCLECHYSAAVGDIMGVLTIKEEMSGARDAFLRKFLLIFLILLPIPFLMSFLVSRFVNSHLGDAVGRLDRKIRLVNSMEDLTGLEAELESEEHRFRELDNIFAEFITFIRRIKGLAVGKEMLEFEIRVLERFIITSDTIRDWKDRVGHLLNEVNTVMPVYMIFSVFQIEDEAYDIDFFWSRPPSGQTKLLMEAIVRQRISQEKLHISDITAIEIIHNIVNPNAARLDIAQPDVEIQTKALFLEIPQVGGVVGIGVQSQDVADPIRSLVINGILTNMLNVVGSIKAMYKYTRDLEYYATRDPLTDLFNQRLFWELLGYEVGRAERHQESFGLLMIDLDNFKQVNDTFGHFIGDKFLAEAALTIHECLRNGDILARYGGDEFTVILPESGEEQAYTVAERIREALARMEITAADGTKIGGSASIGMALYPRHAKSPKDLFLFADNMNYKAKSRGKNCIILPNDEDVAEVFEKSSEMSRQLLRIMEEKKVIPYFQPIVTSGSREIVCHEMLCRIEIAGKIISASEFIEIAEKLAIISKLDSILMEKAFARIRETGYQGLIFINLSPKSLIMKEFIPMVTRLTREYDIRHDHVVFEITERETVKNMALLEGFVAELKIAGFKFAIDDFGSGFSSFQYVRKLPIDFVKIEGMFVRNMLNDPKDMAIVKTLAILAAEFGIKTVAECIEDEALLEAVHALGIDYVQGYYTGRPMPDFCAGSSIPAAG